MTFFRSIRSSVQCSARRGAWRSRQGGGSTCWTCATGSSEHRVLQAACSCSFVAPLDSSPLCWSPTSCSTLADSGRKLDRRSRFPQRHDRRDRTTLVAVRQSSHCWRALLADHTTRERVAPAAGVNVQPQWTKSLRSVSGHESRADRVSALRLIRFGHGDAMQPASSRWAPVALYSQED